MFKLSGYEPEVIDTADTVGERDFLLGEYKLAFGGSGKIYWRREKQTRKECDV